ncbi:Gfo/Idh/MocA family oxidoreductase [Ruminococcaceae bacterium OttesenSCG-928-I18]|nr:Gfo/Idh/MocA family oxidoreductase [Ruminococcaceae bacterium OttesenSCG-928-I18]
MKNLIIGLGSMGKRRARLIAGLGAAYGIWGVDSSPERRKQAEEMGISCFSSLPEALQAGRYDAAFVCTAPLTHSLLIDSLLDAGLPVFTELNLVPDGYGELMEKAEKKCLALFLSSTMLYRAETRILTEEIAAFDKPVNYLYHIGQYLPDWHPWENYKDFFVGDRRTGGVREIFGIELPWLLTAFGPVEGLFAQRDKISSLEITYPDSWFVTLRHESGAKGFVAADVVSPKPVRNFEVYGEGLHLFWEGTPGSLAKWDGEKKEKVRLETYEEIEQDKRYSDNIVENAYLEEILNFYGVIAGKEAARWSFAKDLVALRLIDQMETAEGGCAAAQPGEGERK